MNEPIYAVVYKETTHIPGDERSRTNPGHGYPAYDKVTEVFQEFENREDWEKWIKDAEIPTGFSTRKREYRAFTCYQVEVKASVHVSIEKPEE